MQTLPEDFAELATAFLDDIMEPHAHDRHSPRTHATPGEHGSAHLHALSAAPRQHAYGGIRNRDHDHVYEHDDSDEYDGDAYNSPANKRRSASVSFGGKRPVLTGLDEHAKNDRVAAQGSARADAHDSSNHGTHAHAPAKSTITAVVPSSAHVHSSIHQSPPDSNGCPPAARSTYANHNTNAAAGYSVNSPRGGVHAAKGPFPHGPNTAAAMRVRHLYLYVCMCVCVCGYM
jgi:hypothetical protein